MKWLHSINDELINMSNVFRIQLAVEEREPAEGYRVYIDCIMNIGGMLDIATIYNADCSSHTEADTMLLQAKIHLEKIYRWLNSDSNNILEMEGDN